MVICLLWGTTQFSIASTENTQLSRLKCCLFLANEGLMTSKYSSLPQRNVPSFTSWWMSMCRYCGGTIHGNANRSFQIRVLFFSVNGIQNNIMQFKKRNIFFQQKVGKNRFKCDPCVGKTLRPTKRQKSKKLQKLRKEKHPKKEKRVKPTEETQTVEPVVVVKPKESWYKPSKRTDISCKLT